MNSIPNLGTILTPTDEDEITGEEEEDNEEDKEDLEEE